MPDHHQMSKAFTKEDTNEDQDAAPDPVALQIPQGKNYITPSGYQKLKNELHELLNRTRPDLVQVVSWAASNGDRSENGDYLYGKKKLREIDRRIRFLTQRLESAEQVDPEKVSDTLKMQQKVQFGATVLYATEDSVEKTISIVGIDESNPSLGKISWISPLARCLLNHCAGDVVTFQSPKGEEELEILKVVYGEKGIR